MTKQNESGTLWGSHLTSSPAEENIAFCSGRDIRTVEEADRELLPFDLWASEVHAVMLYRVGILKKEEIRRLLKAFARIHKRISEEGIEFDPAKEDVHTHIEALLSEICGPDIGGKIHTGRSRNDQAACAVQMYLRESLLLFHREVLALLTVLVRSAKEHSTTVMPGLTHRQYASASSYGHLLISYSQALVRDLDRLASTYDRINVCPLGAAAGYGTSWPVDRNFTSEYLAFDGPMNNSLDAVGSRGEMCADLVGTLSFFMNHAAQIAADMIFWSSSAVNLLDLPDSHVTGSSIMPQKRNPDFAEVVLAKSALVQGCLGSLLSLTRGAQSGYNREYQWTKYIVMDAVRETREVPGILAEVIEKTSPNVEKMAEACKEGFLNAIDIADFLALEMRMSFREAHRLVGTMVRECREEGRFVLEKVNEIIKLSGRGRMIKEAEFKALCDPLGSIKRRESTGSPNPKETAASINSLKMEMRRAEKWLKDKRKIIETSRVRLQRVGKTVGA